MQAATMQAAPTQAALRSTRTSESDQARAWTVQALCSVWAHQHDRVHDRIDLIERALAALAGGCLDADLRREAERAAHMLAGSLGMFGFIGASDAARALELGLAHPTPDRAPALRALLLGVRAGVQGPVTLCPEVTQARSTSTRARSLSTARPR